MIREKLYLDDNTAPLISYYLAQRGGDNRPELSRMRRILRRAILHELTDRQRDCLTLYYLEGMKMKDIAEAMELSKSTVSRHIKWATAKLKKIADYYERIE